MRITLFIVLLFGLMTNALAKTGFYTGLVLGPQFGQSSDKTGAFGYNANNNEWNYNESGFNAGLLLGYGFAWRQFVIGPEIEVGYLDLEGSGTQSAAPGGDTIGKTSSDFYTALRARAEVEFHHYLLFLTAGAIAVNYKPQVVDSCNVAPCGGSTVYANNGSFDWGYTVGAGIERMLQKGWSVKLEYLYFDLNNQTVNGITNLGTSYHWTAQTSGNIIRGGVNYYF